MYIKIVHYSRGNEYAPRDPLLIQCLQKRDPCSELFNNAKIFIAELLLFMIEIVTGYLDDRSLEGTLLSISPCRFRRHCGRARWGHFAPLGEDLARE